MAFETHTVMPNFRLHVKRTKQFKTTALRVFLSRNLDERTTHAALLPYILRRGTRSHPTMTRISRHLENLYGTAVGTDVSKVGEWQILSFAADVPNERYLPTRVPILERALEFLNELIFFPAGDGKFIEEFVQTEKDNLRKFILSLPENRPSYALERLIQLLCEGEPYSRYEYGYLNALKKLRPQGLFKFYSSLRSSIPVDIYVLGDVAPEAVLRSVEGIFKQPRSGRYKLLPPVVKSARRKARSFEERSDVAQGHLFMGYRCRIPFGHRNSHALAVAGAVLGGFAHSKLFRVVREKASLAYSVGTRMIRSKGIMVAYAGVEPGNEAKARKLIEKQMAALQAGRISNFELDSTKSSILDDLAAITDSPSREIDFHFVHQLHGEQTTPEEIAHTVSGLTKRDLSSAAAKLKLDTVFVLTKQPQPALH
jgi:predicted Zn-dependent peptidase